MWIPRKVKLSIQDIDDKPLLSRVIGDLTTRFFGDPVDISDDGMSAEFEIGEECRDKSTFIYGWLRAISNEKVNIEIWNPNFPKEEREGFRKSRGFINA